MAGKFYIGIDPGANGAAVMIDDDGKLIEVIEFSKNTDHDVALKLEAWRVVRPTAAIEKVHAMPKQGVSSTFKFGVSYGFLCGVLTALQIPFEYVTPQAWQKAIGCSSGGDKNVTKAAAQRLYPDAVITHAKADAILIATYLKRIETRATA